MLPAIALNKVAFGFSGNGPFVFEQLDLTIQQGENRAILGMNGSGKTTLARLMSGILKPTQGEIRVHGVINNVVINNRLQKRVGLVFQNPDHQWITNSVDDEIAFGLCQIGLDPNQISQRVEEAKERFNIHALSQRSPNRLSGGEKRRVAIAAIWVLNPDIWVLDEPMAYLDEEGQEVVKDWLSELRSQGKTVIYFGHRLDEIINFDMVSILSQSKIIWEGTPKSLIDMNPIQWGVDFPEANRLWLAITQPTVHTTPIMSKEELIRALWGSL